VTTFRISEAAALLGVSSDTVRRWVDGGRLSASRDEHGHRLVPAAELAAFVRAEALQADAARAGSGKAGPGRTSSARNRMRGIVTDVRRDGVMAQVEIQAGPFRLVSLMSREAADQLGLDVGVVAEAVVKSTNVVVERPE
jgi:molybdopterin-binding protein